LAEARVSPSFFFRVPEKTPRTVCRCQPVALLVSISLASARARGRKGGRPAKLPAKQVCSARKMAEPRMTIKEVAEAFGVNRATIYRSFGLGSYAKGATGDAA
jgi:hypothetical protein